MITFKQDSGNTWKRRNSKYVVVLKTPGNADICVCLRHMATWDDGMVRVGDQRDSKNFAIVLEIESLELYWKLEIGN